MISYPAIHLVAPREGHSTCRGTLSFWHEKLMSFCIEHCDFTIQHDHFSRETDDSSNNASSLNYEHEDVTSNNLHWSLT